MSMRFTLHPSMNASPARPAVRSRRAQTLAGLMVMGALVSGCYTYAPVFGAQPAPGQRVSFMISDQGRVALADQVASGVIEIEGTLVNAPDGVYNVSVFEVSTITGSSHWSGERVALRKDHVAGIKQRRFSRGRTFAAVGATVVAVGAFIISRGLFGTGSPDRDGGGGGNPGEQ
jgi:hypothetical protein